MPSFVSEDRVPLAREKKQEVITEYAVKDGENCNVPRPKKLTRSMAGWISCWRAWTADPIS